MSESVKIDKYVLKDEKSPRILIFDKEIQQNIVSVNTLNNENNLLLAEMILAELNTGKYEVVEDDSGVNDSSNDDGLSDGDNGNPDGVTPIDESEGNNGAVEPDVNNDIGSDTGNTDGNDEDLNDG